ncbi:six-cysteine ranthipeptide SCIFF [Eubacterium aggregans]
MEHVTIVKKGNLADTKNKGCGECQTSCQSACKTSCTVGNQKCKNQK